MKAPLTLVFPATHPEGLSYIRSARERTDPTIAATSAWDADVARQLDELLLLPFVHDESFEPAFMELIRRYGIARIFAPVAAVHAWLSHFLKDKNLPLHLIGVSPINREMQRHQRLALSADFLRPFVDEAAGGQSPLGKLEITAVLKLAEGIYGESNEQKIASMMGIFSNTPRGDVVEIGSLTGRSAAVLTWLARRFQIGNVLAIDPWCAGAAVQFESPAAVRDDLVKEWDYEVMTADFITNLLPVGLGNANYLRAPSSKGHAIYASNTSVATPEFGQVTYQGRVAVLHVDGNHDYTHAKEDCDLWLPHLTAGGWLILGDYIWLPGDGPRRVGDELLFRYNNILRRSFIRGKSLFLQFNAN